MFMFPLKNKSQGERSLSVFVNYIFFLESLWLIFLASELIQIRGIYFSKTVTITRIPTLGHDTSYIQ